MAALDNTVKLAGQTYVLVSGGQDVKSSSPDTKQAPTANSMVKKLLATKVGKGKGPAGLKPVRVTLPYSFTLSATSGVISTPLSVTPDSNATEWAAFQTLYDQYRVIGGEVHYTCGYQTPPGSTSTDVLFSVMGYDPSDGAALTSVRQGTELAQHKLLAACPVSQATNTTALSFSFPTLGSTPHLLRWRTGPVTQIGITSGAITAATGQWKNINSSGNNSPDGWLKFYGTTDLAATAVQVYGINRVFVEFRSRR